MTINVSIHRAERMTHTRLNSNGRDSLCVEADGGSASIFVPPHVAEATAAAFNRAMQAIPDRCGSYLYTTDRQTWRITDEGHPIGWRAQSDEITGDGDPHWLFAEGKSLFDVMDEIDAAERDNGCERCELMPGLDNLYEIGRGKDMEMVCGDCFLDEGNRQQEMREMADDDKAHALMERAAE